MVSFPSGWRVVALQLKAGWLEPLSIQPWRGRVHVFSLYLFLRQLRSRAGLPLTGVVAASASPVQASVWDGEHIGVGGP